MQVSTQTATPRKKRTRFYETYISKLLKQVSPDNGITSNAKQQLNSTLCAITKLISHQVSEITQMAKKRTTTDKEVYSALNTIFVPELAKSIMAMCEQALVNYTEDVTSKGSTRQERAGIIFPPSVAEKYLRNFSISKLMVSSSAPVVLAAAVECLAGEILENASQSAKQNKRVRLTIRDLEIGIRTDEEISAFFNKHNISFLGGGVMPYIPPSLLVRKPRRYRAAPKKTKRSHRYRPGTVSLREIKRFQKTSNCLTLPKFPFERYTRSIIKELEDSSNFSSKDAPLKVSKELFITLQYFVEQRIVSLLQKAGMVAIHAGRVKLLASDIALVKTIEGTTKHTPEHAQPLSVEDKLGDAKKEFIEADTNHDGHLSLSEFQEWKKKKVSTTES